MTKPTETIILSLGGSIIVPDEVDGEFLKKFRELILKHVKQGKRFFIITGGGKTCRRYQAGIKQVLPHVSQTELDWIGIYSTHFNAQLVKIIFEKHAYHKIMTNPTEKIHFKSSDRIILAAGWEPGASTDIDSVLLAKNFGITRIINLSNIDFVFDNDPKYHKDAKPFRNVKWNDFRKLVGNEWKPGLNAPFDPIASREAQKLNMTVIITNGRDLENLDEIISGKPGHKGTVIS
ncbi:MAG: UMP kinase [Candidatus Aenigmatarchaeota archaeon]